ncbi:MAG: DUF4160 domain-containing protein [Ignavibacterium sp.]
MMKKQNFIIISNYATYGEFSATIKINDLGILEGYLPPKALGLVVEWANIHKKELEENWNRASNNLRVQKIDPLE